MNIRIRFLTPAAVVATALALAACGGSSSSNSVSSSSSTGSSGGTPQRGGNLVIDTATPSQDFDVNTTSDNESIWPLDEVAETLYVNGSDGKTLKPWLATSYTLSKNKLHWTFHLRHGVRF